MSQKPFFREPTFWTTSNAEEIGFNKPDRESIEMVEGRAVRIKHPQAGHQGDYDDLKRLRGEGYRWITVVKSDGRVVPHVITCGAGDMDPNSPMAIERKQKARFHGWFPLGKCPVALLRAGEMHEGHFANRELVDATPCDASTHSLKKPCPHAIAERDARAAKHTAIEAESAAAHENKLVEAQKAQTAALVAASQHQTAQLVGAITTALAPVTKSDARATTSTTETAKEPEPDNKPTEPKPDGKKKG